MIGVALGAGLIAAFFVVQHLRHGWPFSLHHCVDGSTTPVERAPTRSQHGGHRSEPRVEISLPAEQIEVFGIRTEPVREGAIARTIHSVATVVPDESRLSHVHTRVSGWIERFYVNTTGQPVRRGQALADIFSQDLLLAQSEYLLALRASSSPMLVDAARTRLETFGMSRKQIDAIGRSGRVDQKVTIFAPRSGIVLQRGISVGTAVDPSTELMAVVDLSVVWVIAEIAEPDVPDIDDESVATLAFPGTGREPFEARVDYVYPTLTERTRTLRVRFVVDNDDGLLRPGSYGTATFRTTARRGLTVPRDAVIDTGLAQHVFVAAGEGRFVPRRVVTGVRVDERVEIREGLVAGESVVSSGVFLIDSESRLRASGVGGGHAHGSMSGEGSKETHAEGHAGHGGSP